MSDEKKYKVVDFEGVNSDSIKWDKSKDGFNVIDFEGVNSDSIKWDKKKVDFEDISVGGEVSKFDFSDWLPDQWKPEVREMDRPMEQVREPERLLAKRDTEDIEKLLAGGDPEKDRQKLIKVEQYKDNFKEYFYSKEKQQEITELIFQEKEQLKLTEKDETPEYKGDYTSKIMGIDVPTIYVEAVQDFMTDSYLASVLTQTAAGVNEGSASFFRKSNGVEKAISKSLNWATGGAVDAGDGVLGPVVEMFEKQGEGFPEAQGTVEQAFREGGAINGLIAEIALFPPLRMGMVNTLTGKAVVELPKLPFVLGLGSAAETYQQTEDVGASVIAGTEGFTTGMMFELLHYPIAQARAIMNEMGASPMEQLLATATINSTGFAMVTAAMGGTPKEQRQSAMLGGVLALPGVAQALGFNAMANYHTASERLLRRVRDIQLKPEHLEKMRERQYELGKSDNPEDKMAGEGLGRFVDIKVVMDKIKENPEQYIKDINNSNISQSTKDYYIGLAKKISSAEWNRDITGKEIQRLSKELFKLKEEGADEVAIKDIERKLELAEQQLKETKKVSGEPKTEFQKEYKKEDVLKKKEYQEYREQFDKIIEEAKLLPKVLVPDELKIESEKDILLNEALINAEIEKISNELGKLKKEDGNEVLISEKEHQRELFEKLIKDIKGEEYLSGKVQKELKPKEGKIVSLKEEAKPVTAEEVKPEQISQVEKPPKAPPKEKIEKEPWEMTREEYKNSDNELSEAYHFNGIVNAIAKGKEIPKEVLKDYPELQKKKEPVKPKTESQLIQESKSIIELQTLVGQGKTSIVNKEYQLKLEQLRKEETKKFKKAKAKDLASEAMSDIAEIIGVKKGVEGEKAPKLMEAIKKMAKAIQLELDVVGTELVEAVKKIFKGYGYELTDKDINEALSEEVSKEKLIGKEKLTNIIKLKNQLTDLKKGKKDIAKGVKEITSHIKTNKGIFEKSDFNKLLTIVNKIAAQPKKRGVKGEPLTEQTFSSYLKEALDIIDNATAKYQEKIIAEQAKQEIIQEKETVKKTVSSVDRVLRYKTELVRGRKINDLSGYVRSAREVFGQYKELKKKEISLEKELKGLGFGSEEAKQDARITTENQFLDHIEKQREEIEQKKNSNDEIIVRQAIYEEIALNDMAEMYGMDSKELENLYGNIKRTRDEGKRIEAAERMEKAEAHRKWRIENIELVKEGVGSEYFRAVSPKKGTHFGMKALANIMNTRAWLGHIGIKLGIREKRTLWSDPINTEFVEGKDGVMEGNQKSEKYKRENRKHLEEVLSIVTEGKKNPEIAKDKWLADLRVRNKTGAEVVFADGSKTELYHSKGEIMGTLFMLRDPSTHKDFFRPIEDVNGHMKGMGFTEETVKALEKYVGKDGIKILDKLQEKVPYWGKLADKEHIDLYNVSMMLQEGFIPTERAEMAEKKVDIKGVHPTPSASGGHMKQRRKVSGTYDYVDIFNLYNNYVNDMITYTSYAKTIKKWNSVFGNPKVAKGLEQAYGEDFANMWKWHMNNMLGNVDLQMGGMLDYVSRGFQKGALYLSTMVPIKQTVSTMYWANELNLGDKVLFTKDLPIVMAQVTANVPAKKAGKPIKTVNTEIYDMLNETSFVLQRRERIDVALGIDFQLDQKRVKLIENDGSIVDTYRKIMQGKVKPYTNRAKKFNDVVGGTMIGLADRMPITIGGTAYFKRQYKRLSGKDLTLADIKKAREGNPDKHFKQTLIDWESIAETTQQSTRSTNQARWRVMNQWHRAGLQFTSAQHQMMLARMYHRKGFQNNVKKGNIKQAAKHMEGWMMFAVLSPLVFSCINNYFRIDDEENLVENEQVWDVLIGIFSSGVPGLHQLTEHIKAIATDKPWGQEISVAPVLSSISSLQKHGIEVIKNSDDATITDETKLAAYTKVGMEVLRLKGVNAPKVLRFYKNYRDIKTSEFPVREALGINTDYLEGKPFKDLYKDYRDISFSGETSDEFWDKLNYINDQRGKKLRVDFKDPEIVDNYRTIYHASQIEDNEGAWVINYVKKFEKTINSKPERYVKNVAKIAYVANIAKDKKIDLGSLFIDLQKCRYKLSEEFMTMINVYGDHKYDLSKESERIKLENDTKIEIFKNKQ